jgi:hypothetical protein
MSAGMKVKNYTPLALLAADAEDLGVFSAVLQDAVAKIGDMAYLPSERRFALVANRFIWEEGATKRSGPFSRVRTGVHFDDVVGVRTRALRLDAKDAVVDILAISFEPDGEGAGTITLTLAGGGAIALETTGISGELRDLSDPWRTQSKPRHEDA